MKSKIFALMAGVLTLSVFFTGCQSGGGNGAAKEYKPASNVDWYVASSPGGGSDIFSRIISDIMITEGIVDANFIVTNKTDGGGEVVRNEVAHMKGNKADNTLLTFNSGCLMPMVENTKNRASNFRVIAVMAVDKQLLFKTEHTKYADFAEAIEAAKNGETVVIGGSKGDDVATYEALVKEIGVSQDNMKYITYDATSDAITAGLGGHVDFVMSKPAAASEYVEANSLIPVLALSKERYTGNLADAPTLSEVGEYNDVEVPVWRSVVAPASMSDEAVAFWTEAFRKVSETERWQNEYIDKYKLIPDFMDAASATDYITEFEKNFKESKGIQ
jgi:putative tricarboxylic transport membrane protein